MFYKTNNCLIRLSFILTLFVAIFIGIDQIIHKFYIFDQYELQKIAQKNIGLYKNDTRLMINKIAEDLNEKYPGHIELKEDWVFNVAGGAMGSMWILHGSLTEYVIIFGTPVGTEGHTGRFMVNNYFTIIEGEQWAYSSGELTREVYKPGDMHHLPRGHVQQYKIPEHGFALEYSRGWVPLMLPFGFFDTFFSTVDYQTLAKTIYLYAAIFIGFDQVKHNFYIFDQYELQRIAQKNIELYKNDTRLMINKIAEDLNEKYPGHIELKEDWVFNNAGGAMGSMWILHGSVTEYVIIFGTPVGTEGHTGRFLADDYFIMLEGEQWAYSAGELTREVFKVGEMHHLPRGHCQQYKIPEHGFALEYARGWIPLMLPFGFFDTFFSTVDFQTLAKTVYLYGKAIIGELIRGKI
ncbi:unnamed protein product [Cunninghamella blakesleeana]